jgi:23S rRNA pseudouridine1911/1915/1917 synthase
MMVAGEGTQWGRLPQGPVRMIESAELRAWVIFEDERLLVINKPGDVVCHPSKAGPWSSLVGAVREELALAMAHLIFRLDRETSGVVVFAKDAVTASRLQKAVQRRRVQKSYLAILTGALREAVTVDQPLGDDEAGPVFVKSMVRPDGKAAVTRFEPLVASDGFTLVRVALETGRKHQIRAHAQWLGHSVVGDKIYGPDARLFLEFIATGWTPALAEKLLLSRQALHCAEIDLQPALSASNLSNGLAGEAQVFRAPLPADLAEFCARHGLLEHPTSSFAKATEDRSNTQHPPSPHSTGSGLWRTGPTPNDKPC